MIVYGLQSKPTSVKIEYGQQQSSQLEYNYDVNNKVVLIRRPGTKIDADFKIIIQ